MLSRPRGSHTGLVLLSKAEHHALRWASNLLTPPIEVAANACQINTIQDLVHRYEVTHAFAGAVFQLPCYTGLLDMLRADVEAS